MPSLAFLVSFSERQTSSPVSLVEREREVDRRPVDPVVADRDAVRADGRRVVVAAPADLAGLEVDRLDVRRQVLGVDDAVGDDRRGRVVAERAAALDRHRPGDPELVDVLRADLAALGDAAVLQVAVRRRPLLGEIRRLGGGTFRHVRAVAAAAGAQRGGCEQGRECEEEASSRDQDPSAGDFSALARIKRRARP